VRITSKTFHRKDDSLGTQEIARSRINPFERCEGEDLGRLSRESGSLKHFAAFGHKKTEQQLCWHLVNEAYSSFVPIEKVNSDYGATKIHTLHR
jgi:hypothetical protein